MTVGLEKSFVGFRYPMVSLSFFFLFFLAFVDKTGVGYYQDLWDLY